MIVGIYGSGGQGREILDLTQSINSVAETWKRIVFIDDTRQESERETLINGVEVLTFDEFKVGFATDTAKVAIAVGEPKLRQILRNKALEGGYSLQSLVHPSAFVGTEAQIGEGAIVQYGSFISCNVKLGTNVLVQANASVGHDSIIGSDSVVSSYVAVSGNCSIGERVYLGVNAPIREHISIGAGSIIGMGSVVLRDIPENVIAYGNPARVIKNNESGRVFGKGLS